MYCTLGKEREREGGGREEEGGRKRKGRWTKRRTEGENGWEREGVRGKKREREEERGSEREREERRERGGRERMRESESIPRSNKT